MPSWVLAAGKRNGNEGSMQTKKEKQKRETNEQTNKREEMKGRGETVGSSVMTRSQREPETLVDINGMTQSLLRTHYY